MNEITMPDYKEMAKSIYYYCAQSKVSEADVLEMIEHNLIHAQRVGDNREAGE